MTLFDIMFYLVILLGVLAGISLGVHAAFRMADERAETSSPHEVRTPSGRSRQTGGEGESEKASRKAGRGGKSTLSKRVRKQDRVSFSEFDCEFTGEDHAEKLNRIMSEQDGAYNCLDGKVRAGDGE